MNSNETQWNHEHLGNQVKINAIQRKLISSSGNLWNQLKIIEIVWNSHRINESQRKYMKSETDL